MSLVEDLAKSTEPVIRNGLQTCHAETGSLFALLVAGDLGMSIKRPCNP